MNTPQRPQGDEDAIYRELNPKLEKALAIKLAGNDPELIRDAVAETWFRFMRAQPERSEGLLSWLIKVGYNAALNMLRTEERHPTTSLATIGAEPGAFEALIAGKGDTAQTVEDRELLDAINDLPAEQADVMKCIAIGLSHEEIAERHGLSLRGVRKRIEKANRTLNKRFED